MEYSNMKKEEGGTTPDDGSINAMNGIYTDELFAGLHMQERRLLRRNGLRIRVDKVTADGQNAMCTCYCGSGPFWHTELPHYEAVNIAHTALKELVRFGVRPMVSVVSGVPKDLATMDVGDPFGLRSALRNAGSGNAPLSTGPIPLAHQTEQTLSKVASALVAQRQLNEAA